MNATRMSLVRLAFVNQFFVLPTDEETICEPDKDHRLHAHSDTEHTFLLAFPVLAADPHGRGGNAARRLITPIVFCLKVISTSESSQASLGSYDIILASIPHR